MLTLTEYKFVVCDEPVTCEAGEYLWSYSEKNKQTTFPLDVIKAKMLSVDTMIPKGEKHILLLLVDDEGEAIEIHCREFVNKVMVKRGLYPPIIREAIDTYKLKFQK